MKGKGPGTATTRTHTDGLGTDKGFTSSSSKMCAQHSPGRGRDRARAPCSHSFTWGGVGKRGQAGGRAAAWLWGWSGIAQPVKSHLSFSSPWVTRVCFPHVVMVVPPPLPPCLPLPWGRFSGGKTGCRGGQGTEGRPVRGYVSWGRTPGGPGKGQAPHIPPSLVKDFFAQRAKKLFVGVNPGG